VDCSCRSSINIGSGVRVSRGAEARVEDAEGRVLYENAPGSTAAMDSNVAYAVSDLLSGVIRNGTGTRAQIGRPAAGKTGTTNDHRDAWFVGYTPELTAAVWVGYADEERPMIGVPGHGRVEGGSVPARIWARFMAAALADEPVRDFAYPEHLEVTVTIDPQSGKLATEWCPHTVEVTGLPTDLPVAYCPLHGPPELGEAHLGRCCAGWCRFDCWWGADQPWFVRRERVDRSAAGSGAGTPFCGHDRCALGLDKRFSRAEYRSVQGALRFSSAAMDHRGAGHDKSGLDSIQDRPRDHAAGEGSNTPGYGVSHASHSPGPDAR
jgi:membrane peptidoglycan carboxypeptidase